MPERRGNIAMAVEKIVPAEKFALFSETWSPRIVADLNDAHVKFARLKGEFVWHSHKDEDELFFVIEGRLLMRFRDGERWIEKGEMLVVPRGVEHLPVAPEEALVMMIEPKTTVNTGDIRNDRTVERLERI
jgi:mannose-6-phosphate isomerase-like protein (cupin superfamily)